MLSLGALKVADNGMGDLYQPNEKIAISGNNRFYREL